MNGSGGFAYLGSPYTATAYDLCGTAVADQEALAKQIREQRYQLALAVTCRLNRAGYVTFSPIVHTHAMPPLMGEQPHQFWMSMDVPMLIPAASLFVLMSDGWNRSRGVREEYDIAVDMGKPIFGVDPRVAEHDGPIVLLPQWAVDKGMEK